MILYDKDGYIYTLENNYLIISIIKIIRCFIVGKNLLKLSVMFEYNFVNNIVTVYVFNSFKIMMQK